MNSKAKKLIAREGLAIILTLLLSLMFFYGNIFFSNKKYDIEYHLYTIEWSCGANDKKFVVNIPARDENEAEDVADEICRYSKHKKAQQYVDYNFAEAFEIVKRRPLFKGLAGITKKLFIFFLAIAYPLYLLTHFIIWAIKTLRKK